VGGAGQSCTSRRLPGGRRPFVPDSNHQVDPEGMLAGAF